MTALCEVSTLGFGPDEIADRLGALRAIARSAGLEFGVQIHHGATRETVEALADDPGPFSLHGPALSAQALNLCADDHEAVRETFESSLARLDDLAGIEPDHVCFHGFFLTHDRIPHRGGGFWSHLDETLDPEMLEATSPEADLSYFETRDYHLYKERVKVNLRDLRHDFPGLDPTLKNDLPVPGAGARRPEDMLFLGTPFWVDASHLWASALVHGFDFYGALEGLLESGRVLGIHLHTNPMDLNAENRHVHPGHGRLTAPSDMSWPRIFTLLRRHRIDHYVIEVPRCSDEDLEAVIEWHGPRGRSDG